MKKNLISMLAILLAFTTVTGCKGKATGPQSVKGTLEEHFSADSIHKAVSAVLNVTEKTPGDERFESIMEDKDHGITVWGLMKLNEEKSSEGYGITVIRDGVETDFADIRHGNNPKAYFNNARLWFVGTAMEGTGVHTEQPYLMLFDKDRNAHIIATIDPYDMQQELCKRVAYSIEGKNITLYADGKPLTTVTSKTEDMGEFYDDPIWIGEQFTYLPGSRKLTLCFTPGVTFVTGKVLIYDDMPTLAATVELDEKGFKVSDIRVVGSN